jgi:hypothetical protein
MILTLLLLCASFELAKSINTNVASFDLSENSGSTSEQYTPDVDPTGSSECSADWASQIECIQALTSSVELSDSPIDLGMLDADISMEANHNSTFVKCKGIIPPEARGLSGGFCLASVVEAGWFRSSLLNPVSAIIIAASTYLEVYALGTATNSGGSLFGVRFLALQTYDSIKKWTYPCYLLSNEYSLMCYYHATFGEVANNCFSEYFNLEGAAAGMVYGGLIVFYGGPMGVASLWIFCWFPFLSSLPVVTAAWTFKQFMYNFLLWNVRYEEPANWIIAHTLVNPTLIKQPWNFGWDAYFSRGYVGAPWSSKLKKYTPGGTWYVNVSLSLLAAESANTQSAFVIFPFAFGGKTWTSLGVVAATSVSLRMMALSISLVMVKKLAFFHTVLTSTGPVGCASVGGCPVLDGGFSDNLPLTTILSWSSYKNYKRRESVGQMMTTVITVAGFDKPTLISVIGPSSTMKIIAYVLGQGPLGIWTFSGVNICPTPDPGWCTALTGLREWLVARMPDAMYDSWMAIGDAFQVYRPAMQVVAPFCGDPLAIDEFAGTCSIDSVCWMYMIVMPSDVNKIMSTISAWIVVLSLLFLGNSPLATRFVQDYVPAVILDGNGFYGTMDTWFPNFSLTLPQKGGVGFTSLSGNALMDYLTFCVIRLSFSMMKIKEFAHILAVCNAPACEFQVFTAVNNLNVNGIQWNTEQKYSPPTYLKEELAAPSDDIFAIKAYDYS